MAGTMQQDIWTEEDEGSHYPVTREWWTIESFFTTPDNRKWNLMVIMAYNLEIPNSFFQYTLFDITNKVCVLRKDINDDVQKFIHQKKGLDLQYEHHTMKGSFPDYSLHLKDADQSFLCDINLHALSHPHWIAQDITNGDLPIGLNFYRYGYIPYTNINGSLTLEHSSLEIKGKGYLEHVWGDWSYQKPFSNITNLGKTIRTYVNLGKWWISHHRPKIPDSIGWTTENNIFGYDWAWGVFDNEWSVFYGNILFWLYKGPAFGVLTLSPDGKTFWDFCDISYEYNQVHYVKEYDIYFASDMDIFARLEDKTVQLNFKLATKAYDYIDPFDHQGFYKAFILAEMPARMTGKYQDHKKEIKLEGDCKMMPLRQPSILGHNALRLDFIKPPQGVGLDINLNSHFLKKHINAQLHFIPRPKISFQNRKIEEKDFKF